MKRFANGLLRLFSSYGLACVILVLLCVMVYIGTIEQVRLGLFEAQKRYFSSWYAIYPMQIGGATIPIPLPGVMLLLIIFSINVFVGGLLRLRRKPSNIGLFIVHGGILFLLFGGLVTYAAGYDGQMTLAPGEMSSRFQSYHDWELAVIDTSPAESDLEYTVPQKDLIGKQGNETYEMNAPGLPFTVTVSDYFRNAQVMPKGPMFDAPTPVIGGFFVRPLELSKQVERDMPACYVTLTDKQTGAQQADILWGNSLQPLTVNFGGKEYDLFLRHTTWTLPFAIKLDKFTRELHPGTQQPKKFESDVEQIQAGSARKIKIRMNEPLRSEGYVFFQASYSQDPQTGQFSSTLAVAKNPADHFPLIACVIITIGMLMHFSLSLARHLRREREREQMA